MLAYRAHSAFVYNSPDVQPHQHYTIQCSVPLVRTFWIEYNAIGHIADVKLLLSLYERSLSDLPDSQVERT
jgi:hypothetical protein